MFVNRVEMSLPSAQEFCRIPKVTVTLQNNIKKHMYGLLSPTFLSKAWLITGYYVKVFTPQS